MNEKSIFFRHVIVITCIGWWLFGCGQERKSPSGLSQVTIGREESLAGQVMKEWQLRDQQSVRLKSGATLTFLKVRGDSRCADGVLCFYEDRVMVEFLLETAKRRRVLYLSLQEGEQTMVIEGQAIHLVAVTPSSPIGQSQDTSYLVTLRYSNAKSKIDPQQELEGLRLASLYNPSLGVIELEFIGGQASLIRDANRCRLDSFGDRYACTKIAIFRTTVGFQLMEQSANKYLYQLTGIDGFSFVVDRSFSIPSYRLLVQHDDYVSVEALIPIQKLKQLSSDN